MNPTNGQLVKNKKQQKQFSTSKHKKSKTKKQKKTFKYCTLFQTTTLVEYYELQNTEFSFQFNSLIILSINENRVNVRNNEFNLYRKSEWISCNVKIMQLAKGLVYLATITDLVWFQVTYPSPVKSEKIDVFSIRTSSGAQKVSFNLFWKEGELVSGAPNDKFRENICSEDDLRSRIFETFVVKFLACLPLLGFSNI